MEASLLQRWFINSQKTVDDAPKSTKKIDPDEPSSSNFSRVLIFQESSQKGNLLFDSHLSRKNPASPPPAKSTTPRTSPKSADLHGSDKKADTRFPKHPLCLLSSEILCEMIFGAIPTVFQQGTFITKIHPLPKVNQVLISCLFNYSKLDFQSLSESIQKSEPVKISSKDKKDQTQSSPNMKFTIGTPHPVSPGHEHKKPEKEFKSWKQKKVFAVAILLQVEDKIPGLKATSKLPNTVPYKPTKYPVCETSSTEFVSKYLPFLESELFKFMNSIQDSLYASFQQISANIQKDSETFMSWLLSLQPLALQVNESLYFAAKDLQKKILWLLCAPRLISLDSPISKIQSLPPLIAPDSMDTFSFSAVFLSLYEKWGDGFLSTILTGFLSVHCSWILNIPEFQETVSVSRGWKGCDWRRRQLSELFGNVSLKYCKFVRTIVVGKNKAIVEKIIAFLSYFLRTSFFRQQKNESVAFESELTEEQLKFIRTTTLEILDFESETVSLQNVSNEITYKFPHVIGGMCPKYNSYFCLMGLSSTSFLKYLMMDMEYWLQHQFLRHLLPLEGKNEIGCFVIDTDKSICQFVFLSPEKDHEISKSWKQVLPYDPKAAELLINGKPVPYAQIPGSSFIDKKLSQLHWLLSSAHVANQLCLHFMEDALEELYCKALVNDREDNASENVILNCVANAVACCKD